jgi:hypothetical protein
VNIEQHPFYAGHYGLNDNDQHPTFCQTVEERMELIAAASVERLHFALEAQERVPLQPSVIRRINARLRHMEKLAARRAVS